MSLVVEEANQFAVYSEINPWQAPESGFFVSIIPSYEVRSKTKLSEINLEWHPGFAVCVVLASGGYPDEYKKGFPISGIEKAEKVSGVIIFHAGTTFSDKLVTSGGRVLGVTAVGDTLQDALNRAYRAISFIHFEGMQYRRDIGRSNGE